MAMSLSSCQKFLDVVPDNVATLDNAFSDRYNAYKYLTTCYSYMPELQNAGNNPALVGGDEIWYPETISTSAPMILARGEQQITSPVFDYWTGNRGGKPLYEGIRICNTFLDNIDRVRDIPSWEKDQWKAEVKVLKSYYHFYLIRMYGPMHIMKKSVHVSSSADAIKAERDNVDSCFNYSVRLIDESLESLPMFLNNPGTELGRVTRTIAASLKARMLVTQASPIFNGNPDYATFSTKSGKKLFSSEYDHGKWEKAATACKEAIDLSHEAGFHLYTMDDLTTGTTFIDSIKYKLTLRNRISERWNTELIWGATGSLVSYLQKESQPRLYPCTSNPVHPRHAPTIKIVEQYYSKNGIPIEEDPTYDFAGRYSVKKGDPAHRYYIGEGEPTASLNFDREYRFYSDIAHDRSLWFGNGKMIDQEDSWLIKSKKGEFASIFEITQYSITGYYSKKLVHLENELINGTSYTIRSYAFPFIRLTDLYLLYAEALNEVKGAPDAEVYEYIDKVRSRAGLEGVVDSWAQYSAIPSKPLSKAGMRKIIQQERLIEMSFEGSRFWDLRRWKLAKEVLNKPVRGWSVYSESVAEYYRLKTLYNQSFDLKDYFAPIKEDEIIKNTNLSQNPGW